MDDPERAERLSDRKRDLDQRHEGNRATDDDQPPPTRDRQIAADRQAERAERDSSEG